jgi:hypothetical protein
MQRRSRATRQLPTRIEDGHEQWVDQVGRLDGKKVGAREYGETRVRH